MRNWGIYLSLVVTVKHNWVVITILSWNSNSILEEGVPHLPSSKDLALVSHLYKLNWVFLSDSFQNLNFIWARFFLVFFDYVIDFNNYFYFLYYFSMVYVSWWWNTLICACKKVQLEPRLSKDFSFWLIAIGIVLGNELMYFL